MTVFGKILVFLNLLFSVVTGALIVFVFTTRANWVAAYNDAKAKVETTDTAYKAERASHENDRKQAESTEAALRQETEALQKQLASALDDAASQRRATQSQTALNNNAATEAKRLQTELDQNKSEREAIIAEKESLRTRIIAIQKELDAQRSVAVNADLQAKNLVQRVNNLLRQVEDLTAKNRELEATGVAGGRAGSAASADSVLRETARSAPADVRGKVTGISTTTGMAQINIGSDSGLSPGNVLIVYRGSEYLGDLQITVAEPKVAVGKFVPKNTRSKVEVGDLVITSFGGSQQ